MYCLSARMYHGYKTALNLIDKKIVAKQLFYTFAAEESHPIVSSSKLHPIDCIFVDELIALSTE